MDFGALIRKDLQLLCKKNGIPANLTNVAMANALESLETVEGIEEIQGGLGLQSPKKADEKASPDGPRTGRASSRRAIHGDESSMKQSTPLPRQRLLTKVLPKTPATRKTAKAAKNEEEDEGPSDTPKPVESRNIKPLGPITRRSTRLSSRKPLEETDTIQSRSRRSTRSKATVDKMGSLYRVDADELEKQDSKNDLGEKVDSCVDLPNKEDDKTNKEVESYDLSSSLGVEVAKVEDGNGDSGDVYDAENYIHDIEKGDSCIKLDVEDAMKDQENHILPSSHDCLSSNVEADNPLVVSTEESLPLSTCIALDVEDVMKDQGESHVLSSPCDWVSSNVEFDKPLVVSTEESLALSTCIKLDVEDVMKDQGESHVLSSPCDWVSLNLEVDKPLVVSTEESLPLSSTESLKDFHHKPLEEMFSAEKENLSLLFTKISLRDLEESGNNNMQEARLSQVASELAPEIPKETEKSIDLALDSEMAASFINAFAKSSEQIEDQFVTCEIATCEIIDMPQETEVSQDATQDSNTEFLEESLEEDLLYAAEFSFDPTTTDVVIEKGAEADLAEDNLLNHGELATNKSIATSVELMDTGANHLSEITVLTDKSADENIIPGTDELATPGSVDVATQISSSELQIPASATKISETLPEIMEETITQPAVIAALSSPVEKLPIESTQLSVIHTQLLTSEEADMSVSGMTVEKMKKTVVKENSVQDDLKNISLIKLRAMYKQKLDSKKNEKLERGNKMIREDVEIVGSIVLDEQKTENENNMKLEMENSMIRQEDFEFCSSMKKTLGNKIKLERKTSAIKQSKLDSNLKQKLNEEDKIQLERMRTPLKNLN